MKETSRIPGRAAPSPRGNSAVGGRGTSVRGSAMLGLTVPTGLRTEALGAAAGLVTFALYMIGAGRSYDYDSSETVGTFVATPSLLDPLRRQLGFNNHPLFSF